MSFHVVHYVILGNGVCGITAAFTLRARDKKAKITVVSGEGDFFFSRTALMYAFMDRMERRQLEPFERKLYEKERIDLVRGWVTDLDAGARTLTLKAGDTPKTLSYDALLLATGSSGNIPALEGLDQAKDGVVRFVTLQDLDDCERLAKTSKCAVVVGGGLIGVELVECLLHHKIETHFVIREETYWPAALFPDEGMMVSAHLQKHGVHIHMRDQIARVDVAAARVSGVTLASGKRIDAQMLGLAVGVSPNVNVVRGAKTAPVVKRGIVVDGAFRTSLPSVYAAGDCAELASGVVEQIWYSAKRQGEQAARSMLGDDVNYAPPVFFNSSKFFDIEYTTVGKATPGTKSLYRRHLTKDISQRIVHDNDVVTGFNMLGSRWDNEVLERFIVERRSPAYVVEHLGDAQYDVEFGRTDLTQFKESSP